jgi:hypothetical protein
MADIKEPAQNGRRFSVKKTTGTVGAAVVYAIAIIAVVKDPSTAATVLWPVGTLVATLFGIKTFGGVAGQAQTRRS